jgi:hypothetical protein
MRFCDVFVVVSYQQKMTKRMCGGRGRRGEERFLSFFLDTTLRQTTLQNCKKLHFSANLMSTTVRIFENTLGMRSGIESLPEVFLHDN